MVGLFGMVADYADDKAIISLDSNPLIAAAYLQSHLNSMSEWYTSGVLNQILVSQYTQHLTNVTPSALESLFITSPFQYLTQLDI